jgi:hypothetical protein
MKIGERLQRSAVLFGHDVRFSAALTIRWRCNEGLNQLTFVVEDLASMIKRPVAADKPLSAILLALSRVSRT